MFVRLKTIGTILPALTALSTLPLRARSHEQPARIEVKRGEQVRFVIRNIGADDHEFLLATTPR